MKKADKERMYNNIQKHGENLNKIFNTYTSKGIDYKLKMRKNKELN